MAGQRYVVGWGAVLVLSVGASAGTLVLVRQAIGDGNLADPLSQAQVRSQYDDALHPTPKPSTRPGTSGTATSSNGPSSGPTSPPPTSRPPAGTGGSTSGQHGTGASTQPHPGGSSPSSTSHTGAPPPAPVTKVLTSSGGSVLVRCTGKPGQVYLVSWSPAQGYEVNGVQRGPGAEAEIEFESDASSVSVHYHCTTSGPVQEVETGDAWSGGGGDDGGGGSGGDG